MVEINCTVKHRLDTTRLKKIAERFWRKYGRSHADLSIAIVGDRAISTLNKKYLGHSGPTDVLAFGLQDEMPAGEIILGFDQIKRQAKVYRQSVEAELTLVMVHGLFHLIGYNDDTPARRQAMADQAQQFITKLPNKL
jgi:probable rRNA maturation factor